MDWVNALFLIFVPFFILLALGMPVAYTFILIMLLSSMVIVGIPVGPFMTIRSLFSSIGVFSLAPVPLFVFMGLLLFHSGLAAKGISALSKLLGKLPGRLAYIATGGGALFGLLSGSTMASTAVLGSSLVPVMRDKGYSKEMSFGPVLASGGLAMIIPPSSLAIIYGTIAEVPIGQLLLAGVLPGLIMAFNYSAQIFIRVKRNPSLAPSYEVSKVSTKEKLKTIFKDLLPLGGIVFLVTGIFIIGIATPTEAAAMGSAGTVILAALYRKLDFEVIKKTLAGTVTMVGMTLFIIGGSIIFSQLLSFSGVTRAIVGLVAGANLPAFVVLILMMLLVLIFGSFMESVPIMMVTTPIFVPVAQMFNFNPLWFGIIMLISLQIGLTTPPFGLLHFVMKGVAPKDTTMMDLYRSAMPFLLCDAVSIGLVLLFPALATWLPGLVLG